MISVLFESLAQKKFNDKGQSTMYSSLSKNCAGWNKAMQAGIQQSLLLEKPKNLANFQKLIKRAGWNKTMQAGFFQKINKMCCMFIRQTGVLNLLINWQSSGFM